MKAFKLCVALLLCLVFASAAYAAPNEAISLNADTSHAMNLFLSNFTETGVRSLRNYSEDSALVDFAHDHLWFNSYNSYEYGEYFGGNNCRVSDARIQQIINDYFYEPHKVELSDTSYDYRDGYYYHCETGGWSSDGFALAVNAYQTGKNTYLVTFAIFASGEAWTNGDLNLTYAKAVAKYGEPNSYGTALVYSTKLSDRGAYKLISYAKL